MSEEEIITEIKFVISWIAKIGLIKEREALKGLLDLYYKQQKEIEELNDFIKENPPVIPFIPEDFKKGDDFADLVTLKNKEYISKDKIRQILNNTEKNIEEDRPSIVLENLILNIKELLKE